MLGRQNGSDLFAGVSASPLADLTLTASVHHFTRASAKDAIYNVGGGVATAAAALTTSRDVGNEIDLKAAYKVDAHLSLEVGYSHFFAGKAYATGSPAIGNDVDFAYSQVMFKF